MAAERSAATNVSPSGGTPNETSPSVAATWPDENGDYYLEVGQTPRRWPDLTEDEQARVKRLLTPDPEDNLDDLLARMKRAAEIIRGEKP